MGLGALDHLFEGAVKSAGRVAQRAPTRPQPAPPPVAGPSLRAPVSAAPFQAEEHQLERNVQLAQPKRPTPIIPRLPNPTRAQTQAALNIAQRSAERAAGPGRPTSSYWQELRSDPRQRQYIATVEHYARAMQAHLRAPAQPQPEARAAPLPRPGGGLLGALGGAVEGAPAALANLVASGYRDAYSGRGVGPGKGGAPVGGTASIGAGQLAANPVVNSARLLGEAATGKGPNEVATLPAQSIESIAQLGGAGVAAVKGNTGPLSAIGSGLLQQVEHPVRSFKAHPLATALTLAGAEEAAGSLVGRLARSGALGDTVAGAASQVREPLKLYNDMAVERHWNADPLRKGVQVAADKARAKLPGAYRQLDPNQATGARLQREIKGATVKPGEVDVSVATGEQMRRNLKGEAVHAVRAAKPKSGAEAVPLIVEGVIRSPGTVAGDLAKERARLLEAQQGAVRVRYGSAGPSVHQVGEPLTGSELAANKANVAQLDALLADRKFLANPQPAFDAARQYIQTTSPLTEGLQRVGHLAPEQTRAALFPYAQAHMGARYFSEADHKAAQDAAAAVEAHTRQEVGRLTPGSVAHDQGKLALQAAREQRIAVSGRGEPGAVIAHEEVIARHAEARSAVPKAQEDLRRAEASRARLVGRQQVQRVSNGQAAAVRERMVAADAKVQGAKEALRAANAQHTLARNEAAGSKLPDIKPGLRKPNGAYLPSEEILAHAHANGVHAIGFISHEEGLTGRGSFYKSVTRRPAIASKVRTGESFAKGTYARSYETLVAQAAKMANEYAAHHATDARLGRFGIGEGTLEEMKREAENFSHTPEGERITNALGELVPTPIGPERVRAAGRVHPGSAEAAREQFGITPHKDIGQTPQPEGKYTLLPQDVIDRLKEHEALSTQGALKKGAQKFTNQWRQTALFTSPRWLLGNPQEHAIRLAIGGAAPRFLGGRSGRFAERLVNAYDQIGKSSTPEAEAARQTLASLVRGTHYSAAEQMMIVRKADQFATSPLLGPALHQAEKTTGVIGRTTDAVVAPWRKWRDFIGKGMTTMERESRKASLGKVAIQDIQRFNGRWRNVMKMTDQAVTDYAKGTLTPARTAMLVKETDNMMGAWGHLTPTVRGAVQTWTPFGLWWLTSLRWLRRMPVDHPTKTAILAAINNATVGGAPPSKAPAYLEGGIHASLPLGLGGATLTPTYYSPAGVAIQPVQTAADLIAPQAIEEVANAKGVSFFTGKELTAPHSKGTTTAQRLEIIANDLAGGLVPGYRQLQQLREQGGKTYSTSNALSPQVKPGTQRTLEQTLAKILSPVRFSYDPKSTVASGSPGLHPADELEIQQAIKGASSPANAADQREVEEAIREAEHAR